MGWGRENVQRQRGQETTRGLGQHRRLSIVTGKGESHRVTWQGSEREAPSASGWGIWTSSVRANKPKERAQSLSINAYRSVTMWRVSYPLRSDQDSKLPCQQVAFWACKGPSFIIASPTTCKLKTQPHGHLQPREAMLFWDGRILINPSS